MALHGTCTRSLTFKDLCLGVDATADLCLPFFYLADQDVSWRRNRGGSASREGRKRGARDERRMRQQGGRAAGGWRAEVVDDRDVFGCMFGCGFSSVSFKV